MDFFKKIQIKNLKDLHEWIKKFSNDKNEIKNLDKIINYNLEKNNSEVEKVLIEADLILNNNFRFIDPWDMERCEEIVKFSTINWNYKYKGDPEWMYMFSRMSFIKKLAKAFAYTNEKKYVVKIIELLKDFLESNKNPIDGLFTTWRTIDAGIRFSNLIYSFLIIKNCENFLEENTKLFFELFFIHIDFLKSNYEEWKILSNWGIIQFLPLVQFSIIFKKIYLDFEDSLNFSLTKIISSSQIQILADGGHWEKSPLYHNEVLEVFSKIFNLCRINEIDLPKDFINKIILMHEYNLKILKPNRHQPMQGDSDNTCLISKLQTCAMLFGRGDFKFFTNDIVEEDLVWNYGIELTESFKNIQNSPPKFKSAHLNSMGEIYYRSGWDNLADWIWFSCGSLGSGHGHGNILHFSLTSNGKDFLIDSGRLTYKDNSPERNYLKSQEAHNTIIVNSEPSQIFDGAWSVKKSPHYISSSIYEVEKDFILIEGTDLGSSNKEVIKNRKILVIKNFATILIDDLFIYENVRSIKNNFILDKDVKINKKQKFLELQNEETKIFLYNFNFLIPKISDCLISYNYNANQVSKKIIFEIENPKTGIINLFSKTEVNIFENKIYNRRNNQMDQNKFKSFTISNEKQSYTIFIAFEEIINGSPVVFINEEAFYGKITIKNNITKKITVIR